MSSGSSTPRAVSVYLQSGGRLDRSTWRLVRRLADDVAAQNLHRVPDSNGIWELPAARPLVDGEIGRWLVLDRAVWVARGWRPWAHRRHWKAARDTLGRRIAAIVDESAEGAFLPVSFLAVTALARLGRVREAGERLDAMCARLPRLLAEEVWVGESGVLPDGRLLGNAPLVWSHAELARAAYVLRAAQRRARWGAAVDGAWRLGRYLRLRMRYGRSGRSGFEGRQREHRVHAPRSPGRASRRDHPARSGRYRAPRFTGRGGGLRRAAPRGWPVRRAAPPDGAAADRGHGGALTRRALPVRVAEVGARAAAAGPGRRPGRRLR
ncbi:MAG: hypothetical protein ACT4RN_14180 [Pseudonocardia sp.]